VPVGTANCRPASQSPHLSDGRVVVARFWSDRLILSNRPFRHQFERRTLQNSHVRQIVNEHHLGSPAMLEPIQGDCDLTPKVQPSSFRVNMASTRLPQSGRK
jgi:hypothetical protein